MSIAVTCPGCEKKYSLKDEFAGRRVKCQACDTKIEIPEIEADAPLDASRFGDIDSRFCHQKFLLRQRNFSIDQKYDVRDEADQVLMFVHRPSYLLRIIGAVIATIVVVIILGVLSTLGTGLFAQAVGLSEESTALVGAFVFLIATILGILVTAGFLFPKRHVTFYADESRTTPLLKVLQDTKFQFVMATYTVLTPDAKPIGALRKNHLYNFFRKQWRVLDAKGNVLCIAKEDSIILSLLRRVLGTLFGLLRTNFLIFRPGSDEIVGAFNRKFTLFDRYVLDLSEDRDVSLDRRLAVALGVMLDTGERR